jgi:hypothetical protein
MLTLVESLLVKQNIVSVPRKTRNPMVNRGQACTLLQELLKMKLSSGILPHIGMKKPPVGAGTFSPKRKVERQVKVLIKNLAIFFLFPSKQFLPISFKFSRGKLLPKTEGTTII